MKSSLVILSGGGGVLTPQGSVKGWSTARVRGWPRGSNGTWNHVHESHWRISTPPSSHQLGQDRTFLIGRNQNTCDELAASFWQIVQTVHMWTNIGSGRVLKIHMHIYHHGTRKACQSVEGRSKRFSLSFSEALCKQKLLPSAIRGNWTQRLVFFVYRANT